VAVAVVLFGPKAAGKSEVADVLRTGYGVAHVDADQLVLALRAAGVRPHPERGWLTPVEEGVRRTLRTHPAVSVEATGAWDSDWQLARNLELSGVDVLRVWVFAPLDTSLDRLARRTTRKEPTTLDEARWIHQNTSERARHQRFDLTLDTSVISPGDVSRVLAALAPRLPRATSAPD
jgi:chloramphenicol 3-O-phosphotransferase